MRSHVPTIDVALLVPGTTAAIGMVIVVLVGGLLPRGPARLQPDDRGIMPCPAEAHQDLLSPAALQCWFGGPNGRWRTLSRVSAHGALVVEAETSELSDADEIARQFVADGRDRFSEILLYAQRESASDPTLIRRIRWTQPAGFESLEFTASPAR